MKWRVLGVFLGWACALAIAEVLQLLLRLNDAGAFVIGFVCGGVCMTAGDLLGARRDRYDDPQSPDIDLTEPQG